MPNTEPTQEQNSHQTDSTTIDPRSEEKIRNNKETFIRNLNSERPRIAMVFHEMKILGNRISLTVPTETLYEEIMRNQTEILSLLKHTTHITGRVELDVTVKEDTTIRKPIKVEDKLRYLTEQNPNLTLLRQKLELDIE